MNAPPMNAPLASDAQDKLYLGRLGERHMHDASSGVLPEETALEWCQDWLAKLKDHVAAG